MKHLIILFLFFSSVAFSQNYYPLDKALDTVAPSNPLNLVASNITETTVILTWTGASDNVAVTHYRIYNNGFLLANTSGNVTNYLVTGLTADTLYNLTVRAIDAADNESNTSNTAVFSTNPSVVLDTQNPTTPFNLVTSNITENSVYLTWTASTDNVSVAGYYIYKVNNGVSILATTGVVNSYTLTGLTDSTPYSILIRAFDAAGNQSSNSNTENFTTNAIPDTENPTAPINLVASNITETTVDLTWTAATDNVDVTNYIIYNNGIVLVPATSNVANYTLTGLTPDTLYNLTIRAIDAAGNKSLDSNIETFTTLVLDSESPTSPINLIASNIDNTTVDLNWTASTDNVGVTNYRIYNNGILLTTVNNIVNYTLTGLTPSTTYNLTLRAIDAKSNESNDSNVQTFETTNTNTYSLTESHRTSVGVYDKNDNLLRTLWSNQTQVAGTYGIEDFSWDGLDDDGNNVSAQGDHIKVVANNITATWEGVIGNNSTSWTGKNIHKEYQFYNDILIHNNEAYFSAGYAEGSGSVVKADLTNIGFKEFVMPNSAQQATDRIATDGVRLYSAGRQQTSYNNSYVQAATYSNIQRFIDDGSDYTNPWHFGLYEAFQGATVTIYGRTFKMCDLVTSGSEVYVTGLAVQRSEDNLFVAREQNNSLRILNKKTGALRQSLTYRAVKHCTVDGNDNLWMVYNNGSGNEIIEKFNVNATTGALTTTGFTIAATNVQAMAFNSNSSILAVADIDANGDHRIHAYNPNTGAQLWILGRAENYAENPTVHNDKFLFKSKFNPIYQYTGIAFESDGSLWVGDFGNNRYLKFDPSRNYEQHLTWMQAIYSCQVDPNNISRVYGRYLEFNVNYNKNLTPTNSNNAWTFKNNWIESARSFDDFKNMKDVTTLSNGRTYCIASDAGDNQEFVELVDNVGLRYTGVLIAKDISLKSDGTIYRINRREANGNQTVRKITIIGFDGNNNPILNVGDPKAGATGTSFLPLTTSSDMLHDSPTGFNLGELTSNNKYVVFRGSKTPGYHLGAVTPNTDDFVFKTSKAVVYNAGDEYPTDGTFDIRASVVYCATVARTLEDMIFWGYYGEFWEDSQTNIWHIFNENGLSMYQFGVAIPNNKVGKNAAGMAGNAFSFKPVKYGNDIYLWHNDESHHAGLHKWKISNLDSVRKFILTLD